jgi:predicted transcriptional regulator of viral defense system
MKAESMTLSVYLDHLQSKGQYWFVGQDAIESLKVSDKAFRRAAYRLILKGKLNRVRGDFFVLVPPEYWATQSLPASWFVDALLKYLNQTYYVGLLSAAALHGASHQQPMIFQVITNKLTRSITVGQVHVQFYYKKTISAQFYQPVKTPTGTMNVSTPEVTAFDLVRYMNSSGQINNVATVLYELVNKLNSITLAELLSSNQVEITAAQRLGYILDTLGLDIDLEQLASELKQKKATPRLLVTGSQKPVIANNLRWHILVNEKLEPDEL